MQEDQRGDDQQQQPGYPGSWWAPADPAAGHLGGEAAAAPPPADPPTAAFGPRPGADPGSPPPAGYGQPAGYGPVPAGGYGQPGTSGWPGATGPPAAGAAGGYGQPGAAGPGPAGPFGPPGDYVEQQPPRRRGRGLLALALVGALGAAVGGGIVWAVDHDAAAKPAAAGNPNPNIGGTGNSGSGGAGGGLGSGGSTDPFGGPDAGSGAGPGGSSVTIPLARQRAVVAAVQPGIVDITSNLHYVGGSAAATGMIISSDGLVLTNNHVIEGTTGLTATLVSNHQRFTAKWLGYDKADDVAVLRLQHASGLTTVPLGDSAAVKAGDKVVALGNAEGGGGAPAVVGAITALHQSITASDGSSASSERLRNMLQTSAAIVPGDSGGPLASTAGKVIGMDTAAATGVPGGSQQVAGFAIPINRALTIARAIVAGKSSPSIKIGTTGFLGVLVPSGQASTSTDPATQQQQQTQQSGGSTVPAPTGCITSDLQSGIPARVAPTSSGALILGELCGTSAAAANISAGDVITSVSGKAVTSPSSLTGIMQAYRAGSTATITWTDTSGQQHTRSLVLGQAPPQ